MKELKIGHKSVFFSTYMQAVQYFTLDELLVMRHKIDWCPLDYLSKFI